MPLTIEIWSDVVCPWCYIGKRRFERALAQFEHRDDVEVVWRSFELDPTAERAPSGTSAERLAGKYGMSIEQAEAKHAEISALAAAEGLDFHFEIARSGNTFDAHRLLHLAAEQGVQGAAKERIMRGYFSEGEPVSDPEALVRLVAQAGVDADAARAVLAGDAYADAVRADEALAHQIGIQGVPFFVLGRRYGVSGAQPAPALLGALERAWDELARDAA
jgi:predicted DsbA family dithiol-disulfide isomerase